MRFLKIAGEGSVPRRFKDEGSGLGGGKGGPEGESAVQVKSFHIDTPGDRKGGFPPLVDTAGRQAALSPVQVKIQIDSQFLVENKGCTTIDPIGGRLRLQIIIVNAKFLSRIPAEGNLDEPSSLDLV